MLKKCVIFFRFYEFEKRMPWSGPTTIPRKDIATFDDMFSSNLQSEEESDAEENER